MLKFSIQSGRPSGKIASYLATFDKESVLDLRFTSWQMKIRSSGMLLFLLLLLLSSSSLLLLLFFFKCKCVYMWLQCATMEDRTIQYSTGQYITLQYSTITHITQNYVQHLRKPSVCKIASKSQELILYTIKTQK